MNHCKYIMILITAVVCVSCNEWQSINQIANSKDSFQVACQNSGGIFQNDSDNNANLCMCDNVLCAPGVICIKSNAPGQAGKLACAGNSNSQFLNCTNGETKCYNDNVYVCVNGTMTYDRKCATNCENDACVDECRNVGKVQCGTNPPNVENPNSKYQCVERTLADNKTTIRELKLIETCENGCYESQTGGSLGTNCDKAYRDSVDALLIDYLATLSQIQTNACISSLCQPDYESCMIQRLDLCESRYDLDCKKYQNQVLMNNSASSCDQLISSVCSSADGTNCLNYDTTDETMKTCCASENAITAVRNFSQCMEHIHKCDDLMNDCKTKQDEYEQYGNCNQQLESCKGSCPGLNRDSVEAKYAEIAAECASTEESCVTGCGNTKENCLDACSDEEKKCEDKCNNACMNECLDCGDDCADNNSCQTCLALFQHQIAECRVSCRNNEMDACLPSCETNSNQCKDRCSEQTDSCKIDRFVSGLNQGASNNMDIPRLQHVDCLTGGNYSDCNVQCTDGDEDCKKRKTLCMQERDACRALLIDQKINMQNREKCMSGAFCGDCNSYSSDNNTVCMFNDFASKGIQYQCRIEDGFWTKMSSSCTGDASCSEKSESNGVNPGDVRSDCGRCINGETECRDEMNGGVMYVCVNGEYVVQNRCSDEVSCQFTAMISPDENDRRNWQCGKCTNGKDTIITIPVAMDNQLVSKETAQFLYRGFYDDLACRKIVSSCSDAQQSGSEIQCDRLESCRKDHFVICNRIENMKDCMKEHFADACRIKNIEDCMMSQQTSTSACEEYTNIYQAVADCRNNHKEEACQKYSDDYDLCMTNLGELQNACLKYADYDTKIETCRKEQLEIACVSHYDRAPFCNVTNRPYDFTIHCADGRYPLEEED